jgi:hypothetical protein
MFQISVSYVQILGTSKGTMSEFPFKTSPFSPATVATLGSAGNQNKYNFILL